ncbi:unnamed protein product [Meloidogyne enterolobii]|uniref:Uncharacterized protein n=1 Tax=Meloidogyne enterolobii TaxID=390850 RepID=A0ACB1B7E2_MELEN
MLKILHDLSEPLVPPKETYVQDEFFGVYCLVSKSIEKVYKNRCYIGYTVDPNRRIRQHNSGREHGGAKKTDSKGPWYDLKDCLYILVLELGKCKDYWSRKKMWKKWFFDIFEVCL